MGGDLSFESNSLCSLWLCILEFIEILYMCVNDCASVYLSLEMFYSLPPLSPFSSIWFSKKSRKVALICVHRLTFPGGSDCKASAYNVGDMGSIPESGRSPGEGNGNPLQYSCLENPMGRGAWWSTDHEVAKSQTWLSDFIL